MNIEFATCERHRALEYMKRVYPSRTISDTPESAKPILDLIDQDILRLQDPMMYGGRIALVPGTNWDEARREEIAAIASQFHKGA